MSRIHRLRHAALGVTIALLLSACATQAPVQPSGQPPVTRPEAPSGPTAQQAAAIETLQRMAALQQRLYHVAAPLLIDNAELCKSHARNLLGFTAKNRYSYPDGEYNEAAHIGLGMDERLQVTEVLAGSGAAKAGLKVGDGLVAAGGKPLPTGRHALSGAGAIFAPLVASSASLPLTIDRRGASKQLTIPVTRACAYAIELGNSDNVNAYADGKRIMVTRGMIEFARGDDELAYVVATALAHNVLGHAGAQRNQATIGSIIDNLVLVKPDDSMLIGSGGIKAMPAEMDAAADRLAVYMLARAGYNIDGADDFWKRLASTHPATVLNGYVANHPATDARVAAINKAVAEVNAKKSAKKPLVP
jgi:membrane-associated protease RseP (regulator of RpoE activity)